MACALHDADISAFVSDFDDERVGTRQGIVAHIKHSEQEFDEMSG